MTGAILRRWLGDRGGAGAAEFALVLPLFLIVFFGTIDVGRLMWTWNRAEKATQMAVRYAVVADLVPGGLDDYDFAVDGAIPQGDRIPDTAFGGADCISTSGAVSCTPIEPTTSAQLAPIDSGAFERIVRRVRAIYPEATAANVRVRYSWSGLGYAGNPVGPDVAPLVTVSLRDLTFRPITFAAIGQTIPLPSFSAALTLEDGTGSASN